MKNKYYLLLFLNLFLVTEVFCQKISADDYFTKARKEAFENKNYASAINYSKQALLLNPGYLEIQTFLGRLYYWNKQADSALQVLKSVLKKQPDYEDASIAIADIEYNNKNYPDALDHIDQALIYNPSSKELMLRKAKCFAALDRNSEALIIAQQLLKTDASNKSLKEFTLNIKNLSAKNRIGILFNHTSFNKQFPNAWNLTSLEYGRQTHAGLFMGRFNYANRYNKNGVQFEIDAYPRISKTFYTYINIGYSADAPVFPKFRSGFSLYANLTHGFEAEGGFRYLNFNKKNIFIYTFSLGKYYKKLWFNGRTYLTPSSSNISQSYSVTSRYYLKGIDDYLSLLISTGISPDNNNSVAQLSSTYKLQSNKIGAEYHFSLHKMNLFSLSASLENIEYLPKTKGNQIDITAGYQRRF
jgi:YaiO family outer membrane protein